jgi:hypothetical protein
MHKDSRDCGNALISTVLASKIREVVSISSKDFHLSERLIAIGDGLFRLSSKNRRLITATEAVFVTMPVPPEKVDQVTLIDLDSPNEFVAEGQPEITDQPVSTIKRVVSVAQRQHQRYMFFDACSMVTNELDLVLIVGGSFYGKSTLTAALALSQGWRFISEDLVFIDHSNDRLIPIVSPISLRQEALPLIVEAIGKVPLPFVHERWFGHPGLFQTHPIKPQFKFAYCIEGRCTQDQELYIRTLTKPEFFRKIISHGNCLNIPDGPDYLWSALNETTCFGLLGGSLAERITAITKAVRNNNPLR